MNDSPPSPLEARPIRSISAGAVLQLLGRLTSLTAGLLVYGLLARSLGLEGFAQFTYVLTLTSVAIQVADFGVTQIAVREMSQRPADRDGLLGALVVYRSVTGALMALLVAAIATATLERDSAQTMGVLVSATLFVAGIGSMSSAPQARLRPGSVALISVLQAIPWVAAVVAVGQLNGGIVAYGLAYLIATAVSTVSTIAIARRHVRPRLRGAQRYIRQLVTPALPLGVASLFVLSYYKVNAVLVFHLGGVSEAGLFNAAFKIIDALQAIPITASSVLLPLLGILLRDGEHQAVRQLFGRAFGVLLAVAFPISMLLSVLSKSIIEFVYGATLAPAATILAILAPAFVLMVLGYLLAGYLIALRELRPYVAMSVVAAVMSTATNFVVIPKHGAIGAAWTTVGTELIVVAGLWIALRCRVSVAIPYLKTLRIAAASACGAGVAFALKDQSLFLSLPAAGLVYFAVATAIRAFDRDDLRLLMSREASLAT